MAGYRAVARYEAKSRNNSEFRQLFRIATAEERAALDYARGKMERAWQEGDDNGLANAFSIMHKMLRQMLMQRGQKGIGRRRRD